MNYFLVLALLTGSLYSSAQKNTKIPPPRLICPLANATEVFEKQPYSLGKELKIILSSASDTTVKAGVAGTVTNVQQDEDHKYIVILEFKNYYFWYGGITKPLVREDQKIKAGDILGTLAPGGKLELHFFDFEDPIDPKKLLDCKLGAN
jgi:murein DD-endopeptidase MepM/ murein hydrolase activator NlpD